MMPAIEREKKKKEERRKKKEERRKIGGVNYTNLITLVSL